MKEIWRDIKDYEGIYRISNLGNVYSVRRDSLLKSGMSGNGYLSVILCTDGRRKHFKVHRLVAEAFIENKLNKPAVNHKDEDKHNNNVNNLEWVTTKENINYGTRNIRTSKRIKVIYQDDTYEIWESANVFAREFGVNQSNVCAALHGRIKTAYGMRFEYAN